MVEQNCGNALCGHWRNQSRQCEGDHKSRRGFYRRIVRNMGPSGWSRGVSAAALSVMFGFLSVNASVAQMMEIPENLPTIPLNSNIKSSYDKAVMAYELMDYTTALSQAKVAAAEGNSDAQVMTAHILLRGEAGITDYNQAAENYRKAALQKNTDAYIGLGEMALRSLSGLTPSDAVTWFSTAAQAGRRDAMRALGEMYLKGQGIPPDADKAQHWLDKAGQRGDHIAHRKMADSLFESNPVKSHEYYKKAAAAGDNEAAYIAALMYEEFFEIKPDAQTMAALMKQAANGGDGAAQADYGLLIFQGRGVDKDDVEAAKWFGKAAQSGDDEGMFLYAFTLAKGEGVSQNFEEAYYWLLKAGQSESSDYNKDRTILRERLEQNVDPVILDRARSRINAE